MPEAVLCATNYDLINVQTPVDADQLEYLLHRTHYDKEKTKFLVQGFKMGFSLGYQGPWDRKDSAANIPFSVGNKVDLWNKITKDVELGRLAGPYCQIPYRNFVQSPVRLVHKVGGKTRMIYHLSYVFENGNESINYWTPDALCSVQYNDLDHAIRNSLRVIGASPNPHCKLFYGKTDLASAFRILPLQHKFWRLLICKAEDPQSGKCRFFVNKSLPFGASISCSLFQKLSDALKHIMEVLSGCPHSCTNYLDDYLFVWSVKEHCNQLVSKFIQICAFIKFPVSVEKTEWATTRIVFLGVVLNGERHCIGLPVEKINVALNMLQMVIDKNKITVKQIQRLAGVLNFFNKAIHLGRAFMRRMYVKYSDIRDKKGQP